MLLEIVTFCNGAMIPESSIVGARAPTRAGTARTGGGVVLESATERCAQAASSTASAKTADRLNTVLRTRETSVTAAQRAQINKRTNCRSISREGLPVDSRTVSS